MRPSPSLAAHMPSGGHPRLLSDVGEMPPATDDSPLSRAVKPSPTTPRALPKSRPKVWRETEKSSQGDGALDPLERRAPRRALHRRLPHPAPSREAPDLAMEGRAGNAGRGLPRRTAARMGPAQRQLFAARGKADPREGSSHRSSAAASTSIPPTRKQMLASPDALDAVIAAASADAPQPTASSATKSLRRGSLKAQSPCTFEEGNRNGE